MKYIRPFLAFLFIMVTALDAQKESVTPDARSRILLHQKIRDHVFAAVRGGTFRLRTTPGRPLLLAFLQVLPDSAATPSRSEALYLQSMEHQYGARGLPVAPINASSQMPP